MRGTEYTLGEITTVLKNIWANTSLHLFHRGQKMARILKIHHIGIAVADTDSAAVFWKDALGLKVDHVEDVSAQKSQVTFFPVGESEIELVKPMSDDSSVAKFIADRGPGIHHICLQVDDIVGMLADLKSKASAYQ